MESKNQKSSWGKPGGLFRENRSHSGVERERRITSKMRGQLAFRRVGKTRAGKKKGGYRRGGSATGGTTWQSFIPPIGMLFTESAGGEKTSEKEERQTAKQGKASPTLQTTMESKKVERLHIFSTVLWGGDRKGVGGQIESGAKGSRLSTTPTYLLRR